MILNYLTITTIRNYETIRVPQDHCQAQREGYHQIDGHVFLRTRFLKIFCLIQEDSREDFTLDDASEPPLADSEF